MRVSRLQSVVLFVAFAVVSATLLVAAGAMSDAFGRAVLLHMGSVIFGAGLVIFVLQQTLASQSPSPR